MEKETEIWDCERCGEEHPASHMQIFHIQDGMDDTAPVCYCPDCYNRLTEREGDL